MWEPASPGVSQVIRFSSDLGGPSPGRSRRPEGLPGPPLFRSIQILASGLCMLWRRSAEPLIQGRSFARYPGRLASRSFVRASLHPQGRSQAVGGRVLEWLVASLDWPSAIPSTDFNIARPSSFWPQAPSCRVGSGPWDRQAIWPACSLGPKSSPDITYSPLSPTRRQGSEGFQMKSSNLGWVPSYYITPVDAFPWGLGERPIFTSQLFTLDCSVASLLRYPGARVAARARVSTCQNAHISPHLTFWTAPWQGQGHRNEAHT